MKEQVTLDVVEVIGLAPQLYCFTARCLKFVIAKISSFIMLRVSIPSFAL